jgi:hypothetical protein
MLIFRDFGGELLKGDYSAFFIAYWRYDKADGDPLEFRRI